MYMAYLTETIEILSAELEEWLQEKESNLQLRSQSPTCCRLHHPAKWSRRKESNLRLSIIDRVHCRLCYTAMVDPTGLKPAPHGLKGRCSVTRAPDRKDWLWRKDSNLRWPD